METNDWREGLAMDIEAPHCRDCGDWHTGRCRNEPEWLNPPCLGCGSRGCDNPNCGPLANEGES